MALKKLQKELIAFVGKDEKITFSPDLVYKLIVPKGVSIPQFDSHFLEELGYAVKMEISESSFSRQDIHRILEK